MIKKQQITFLLLVYFYKENTSNVKISNFNKISFNI